MLKESESSILRGATLHARGGEVPFGPSAGRPGASDEQRTYSKRVVICCDQGVPPELVRDAIRVGAALTERGHWVAFLVGDPVQTVDCTGKWIPNELHQAPVLRIAPHLVMNRPPVDGFADLMAIRGFDDKQALLTLALMWSRTLRALNPDLIIGFYSPVLWLVGPGHAPTFALGNGYVLPPILGTSFPRLSVDSSPLAVEELMLSNANAALALLSQPSLAALSDVLGECTSILYGLPVFDPYLQLRSEHTLGLLGETPSPSLPPPQPRLAMFLDVYCPGIEMIVLALAGLGDVPVDICLNGATTGMRRFLEEQQHIKLWSNYTDLLDNAASASVLVHHGEQDVAQRALCLGRPQLIIPWTREQEILNYVMGWLAVSWMKPLTVQIGEMEATLRDILRAESLTVAAQHHARQLSNSNITDALPIILERVEAMALAHC